MHGVDCMRAAGDRRASVGIGPSWVGWGLGSIVCPIVGLLILLCIPNLRTEARLKAQHEELLRNLQPKG